MPPLNTMDELPMRVHFMPTSIWSSYRAEAWNSTVADTVPREDMPQAITAMSIAWNTARALGPALARAIADGAAVVTLGAAVVPALDAGRYRDELARRATAPLVAASALWLVAELVRLVLAAAEATGVDAEVIDEDGDAK